MQRSPTLYKINRHNAAGDSIVVETTAKQSDDKPHIMFCGGFYSSMRGIKAEFLAHLCQRNGWGYTRFDYRGHGASDADAQYCSLHHWLDDTLTVLDSLEEKCILIGSSMGAWLAIHASLKRPDKVNALLTIAAAPDFTEKLLWPTLSSTQKDAINRNKCVSVPTKYAGDNWRIRRCLFDSGQDLALLGTCDPLTIHVPVHMLHGTLDVDVPWTLSQQLLEKFTTSEDATLTLIRGADHRLSDELSLNKINTALEQLADYLLQKK